MNRSIFAVICIFLGAVSGCSRDNRQATASRDYVKITAISPLVTQPVHVGESVEISIDVTYQLSASAGTVDIITQTSDGKSISQDQRLISKGQGTQHLTTKFVVPKTDSIEVLSSVFPEGASQSEVVDSRFIKVVP